MLRSDSIHHRAHVVHSDLEARHVRDTVGQAGAALVKKNKTRERGEPLEEPGEVRLFPGNLDVRDEARHKNEVTRSFANHLVGDVDRAVGSVARLGWHAWVPLGALCSCSRVEIASFVDKIAALSPQLVTFNGSSFDLPVLRYRAMVHGVAAPGLAVRPYFHRYTEDAVDLCNVLSSFSSQAKATLHELCRVMGLPGKPDGMTSAEVEKYYRDGHIREIAEYCESDVLNTYRVWLRYELFRGRLSSPEFQGSEANLVEFVKARGNTKPLLCSPHRKGTGYGGSTSD